MENNNEKDNGSTYLEEDESGVNNNIVKETPSKSKAHIIIPDNYRKQPKESFTNIFLLVCIIGVSLGILLEIINVVNGTQTTNKGLISTEKKKYWVYSESNDVNNRNGVLKHVHSVLERIGYEKSTNKTPWSLLWTFSYPFNAFNLRNITADQKVNHFPFIGSIVHKVNLATSESKYIPKGFKLPLSKDGFLKYAEENKNSLFIQKNNGHRGVLLKNVSEIDVTSGKSFVQEYVQKPFLVDGHKFDIGVYVVLTSVDPLRVYWYKGDVLFRYCPTKYYPFDPKNLDKYVVADAYLPTWEVPSLAHTYTALGNSMKESFDIYVKSKGKDPTSMWEEVKKAITEVFVMKEHHIVKALKQYSSPESFFEMMRFDLIVDEDLKVYLLEANMSPNLSSSHFLPNQLLYEQVLYNLFSLTGVTRRANVKETNYSDASATKDMISSMKNIAVFGDECSTTCKDNCEALQLCGLCKPCLDARMKKNLLTAHGEFLHRGDFRRLIPPTMSPNKDINSFADKYKNLSSNNRLLHLWCQGKCNQDITWCT